MLVETLEEGVQRWPAGDGERRPRMIRPAAREFASTAAGGLARRLVDVAVALVLLVATIPLCALLALAVKLDSRGPVLYRCRRIGRHGERFTMLKFRKMAEDAAGPALTACGDRRFTRVGRVLAKLKLDELPQLLNIVRGDMGLVGPRPEDPVFVELHADRYRRILQARPGITGLSQLAFARESEVLGRADPERVYLEHVLPQKLELDALYADRCSPRMDARILGWTAVAVVLRQDVAVDRATGRLTLRRRPQGASQPHRRAAT